jgi:hypothetical protein
MKDRNTERRAGVDFSQPVAAGARIFTGAVVVLNAEGFAEPATAAEGFKLPSIALAGVDNSAGGDGAVRVEVARGVFGLDHGADITRAHIGQIVYLPDDHSVTAEAGGHSPAGRLVDLALGQAWVDLTQAHEKPEPAPAPPTPAPGGGD